MLTNSDVEQHVRAQLRLARFMSAYLPFSLANRLLAQARQRVRLPPTVRREPVDADGVRSEWLIPERHVPGRVLLYLHGGGFVLGLSPQHLHMVTVLAQLLEARALLVDYRLAPQHPFPAALEDCVTAYRWLLRHGIHPTEIAIAGDSAGGNLTIASLMKLRDEGTELPAAAACLSPVGDLAAGKTRQHRTDDPVLHPRAMARFDRSYVNGHDPRHPLISPVYGDWHGLPPLLFHAGEDEILRDDAERMAAAAQAAGVVVELTIFPRMWHVWQLTLELPQAQASLQAIASFLLRHLAPAAQPTG